AALAVTLGPLVGLLVGWAGARLLDWGVSEGWINEPFERLSSLALAFLAFAGAELVGGNGFIAAFVAGLTLGNVARNVCETLYEFGETEGQLLTLGVFMLFGAVIVPEVIEHATPAAAFYALCSLTLVRALPVAIALAGTHVSPAAVLFVGWFGPRGLASILFVLVVVEEGRLAAGDLLESVVMLTVLSSALLHGATAYPFAKRFGAYAEARSAVETQTLEMEIPVRIRHRES
ncbi:MAG: cation:proton antiporter, partial [Rhodopirellula sp.]|nr:cation:proton antiporter [Rhodopirellula sp.]